MVIDAKSRKMAMRRQESVERLHQGEGLNIRACRLALSAGDTISTCWQTSAPAPRPAQAHEAQSRHESFSQAAFLADRLRCRGNAARRVRPSLPRLSRSRDQG